MKNGEGRIKVLSNQPTWDDDGWG